MSIPHEPQDHVRDGGPHTSPLTCCTHVPITYPPHTPSAIMRRRRMASYSCLLPGLLLPAAQLAAACCPACCCLPPSLLLPAVLFTSSLPVLTPYRSRACLANL